jgi:hypothetical protein
LFVYEQSTVNEKQYREICDACDSVLLAADATRERVAIPWLHVLRAHPTFLKEYEPLLDGEVIARFARIFRYRAGWLRQLWRALWSSDVAWFGADKFPKSVDVLFVSHLLDSSHAGSAVDFYFGDLPERVQAAGLGAVLALIDHTGAADKTLAGRWQKSDVPRFIFPDSLGVRKEVSLYRRMRKEALRLYARSGVQASALMRRVFARASEEALSGSARTTLRLAWQIGRLVSQIRPKAIVVTYEGHAWERLVFAAAREAHSEIACIGYQHSAIFHMQHSALRKLSPLFNPDHLLAAGAVGKEQLDGAPGLRGIPVEVLGSSRAGGASTRNDAPLGGRICLVLPEGIVSECNLLFEFSLHCAKLLPDMNFVWRLHPLVTFESLVDRNSDFIHLPDNVELSQATMEEDVARAAYALYRGSTAIVRAVCAGVQPIYLGQPEEISIDPLYQLDGWRETVTDPTEFLSLVETSKLRGEATDSSRTAAMKHCESFYSPFEASVLVALLQKPPTSD